MRTMSEFYIVSNELYHHGILGQKWGVRRFQNPDGSLTAAGRARYINSNGELTEKGKRELSYEQKRDVERQHPHYRTASQNLASDKKLNKTLKSIKQIVDDADSGKIKDDYGLMSYEDTQRLKKLNSEMNTRVHELVKEYGASSGARRAVIDLLDEYQALDVDDFLFNYGTFSKKGTTSVKSPSDAKKVIQADSKIIAKQAAKEMASDVLRWEKEGSSERHYNLKGMNKQQLEDFFEKKIEASISKGSQHDPDLWDDDSFNFVMDDVIEEYGMPVDFDYDWKNKKVTSMNLT